MNSRALLGLATILALGAAAPLAAQSSSEAAPASSPAPRTEAETRAQLAGTWVLAVSRSSAQTTIESAIERAVSEMNFFVQGVTRSQLREKTPINERIDVAMPADGQITVGFDQRFSYTTRPGVAQQFRLPDGAEVAVTQHFREGNLEQYFEHSLGRRWSTFTLSPDGRTMTMSVTMQGPMMPQPVRFSLRYRRPSS